MVRIAKTKLAGGAVAAAEPVEITPDSFPARKRVASGRVAKLFGVSRTTVSTWCRNGDLPAVKLPGDQYRILWADAVALWERSQTCIAVADGAPGAGESNRERQNRHDKDRARLDRARR